MVPVKLESDRTGVDGNLDEDSRIIIKSDAWVKVGSYWQVPCKSSITEARQRIGAQVMCRLFHLVVSPLSTEKTPGAFLGGLRIMAMDGSVLGV